MATRGFDFEVFDRAKVPPSKQPTGRPSAYDITVRDFLVSAADCVRVDPGLKEPRNMAAVFRARIRKLQVQGQVTAVARGDNVFLLRVKP